MIASGDFQKEAIYGRYRKLTRRELDIDNGTDDTKNLSESLSGELPTRTTRNEKKAN